MASPPPLPVMPGQGMGLGGGGGGLPPPSYSPNPMTLASNTGPVGDPRQTLFSNSPQPQCLQQSISNPNSVASGGVGGNAAIRSTVPPSGFSNVQQPRPPPPPIPAPRDPLAEYPGLADKS